MIPLWSAYYISPSSREMTRDEILQKKTLGTITNQKKVCQMAHFPFECPDYKAIKRNLFIFSISFYITVLTTWFTLWRNYFWGFVQDSNLIWILHFLVSFTNHKGDKNLACFKIKVSKSRKQISKFSFETKKERKYFCIHALASKNP